MRYVCNIVSKLKNLKEIRKVIAALLLLVFAISFIPKKYVHDVLFSHCDSSSTQNSEKVQLQSYQFNCGFVNDVAITPFLEGETILLLRPITYNCEYILSQVFRLLSDTFLHFNHRGPPQIA